MKLQLLQKRCKTHSSLLARRTELSKSNSKDRLARIDQDYIEDIEEDTKMGTEIGIGKFE